MRKLAAFIVCGLIALLAGYSLLPTGFNALIDWLGPIFGLALVFVLSSLFILAADPLRFIPVAILWAVVGIVGGMMIRRRVWSVTTMLSVYSAQFSVLGLSTYGLFNAIQTSGIVGNMGDILSLLPPVPEGASLASIIGAPIVSDIYSQIQGLPPSSLNQGTIIGVLMNTIILNIVKNLAILSAAALAGCELGKLAMHPISPRIEAFRTRHMVVSKALIRRPLLAILALLVLLSSLGVAVRVNADLGFYSETIVATVTPSGTAVAGALFIDTSEILRGIDLSNPAFNNSVAAVLMTQKFDLSAITTDISYLMGQMRVSGVNLNDILKFYQLIPPTMLVLVYRTDRLTQEAAQSQASTAASLLARKFDMTFTPFIPTGSLPLGEGPVRVFLYQSELPFSNAADKVVWELPETARGGLARYIGEVYRSGVLTPRRTSFSANGTVLLTGFVNFDAVRERSLSDSASGVLPFLSSLSGKTPFWGLGCFFASRFHSSPVVVHELNIADLFGTSQDLAFSSYSNASSIITFIPTRSVPIPGQSSSPIVSVDTTLNATDVSNLAKVLGSVGSPQGQAPSVNLTVSTTSPGSTIDPRALALVFTQRFPLQLRVVKSASVEQVEKGQVVTITVTVINDDSEAAEYVQVDDSAWRRVYPSATLVAGFPSASYTYVNASSSMKFSYSIKINELGTYTMPAASILYSYKGDQYIKSSNSLALQVPRPGAINVLPEGTTLAWTTLVSILNQMPQIGGSGNVVLAVIVAGVVSLIVFTQYRGYRKWLRGPSPSR